MRPIPCLALLSLLLAPAPPGLASGQQVAAPPAPEPGGPDLELLRAGEVLVENTNLDETGGSARVQALFEAPVELLWEVLGDCDSNYRFVDGLLECEVLESTATRALTRQSVKKHLLAPRMDYEFATTRQPHAWIVIQLVSGDLQALDASWRFDPMPGGTGLLVTHQVRVQPKMPVPSWLVRRALRKDLGDMVACLRSLVSGSGSDERRQEDEKRCP